MKKILSIITLCLLMLAQHLQAQHLHAVGKEIHDAEGNNFLIRSMGLGGWMLQEGYLLKTAGVLGTQWEYRAKLEEMIGEEKTQEFYDAWLANHFTKADLDSLKEWGFNTVRVPLHYNLFTLPIENEPVLGEQTWLTKGFEMTDELLSWCQENNMYLILDLHAAPGGQGKNADICDYDPSKPSLWESEHNRDKMVALWGKLAERYGDQPWIGGYDLLNETNWTFPSGNNEMMLELYKNCTAAIRAHDTRNIIYIEGNSWANDFTSLTPPWDDNMAYSFHKYWTYNRETDLDWVLWMRDEFNVPLWLGETGENSNVWYTDLIHLCETNNVGWSWWPHKKAGINNPMEVTLPQEYEDLIKYWKGEITERPTEGQVYNAVMSFAESFKIENVKFKYDVIDAMFRQPYSLETKPFIQHDLNNPLFLTEYDLGRNGYAYFDNDVANYSGNGGEYSDWNTGWSYRNDGVDIQACQDEVTNGYNIGWIETGEWMQYTVNVEESQVYDLLVRSASGTNEAAIIEMFIDDVKVGNDMHLSNTGGWDTWSSTTFENYVISKGTHRIKIFFKRGGSNLNYIQFENPRPLSSISTEIDQIFTNEEGTQVHLALNKAWNSSINLSTADVEVKVNGNVVIVSELVYSQENSRLVTATLAQAVVLRDEVTMTLKSDNLLAEDATSVGSFDAVEVENKTFKLFEIPGKIIASDFFVNNGFELEATEDDEGGENLGYADVGDYVDYKVQVETSGFYALDYRIATENDATEFELLMIAEDGIPQAIQSSKFSSTSGWQTWKTFTTSAELKEGNYIFRFKVKEGAFNINWMDFHYKVVEGLTIPGRIEAEFFKKNEGLSIEKCNDIDGGYNLSYTDPNDYLEYNVNVEETDVYKVDYRVASAYDNAGKLKLEMIDEEGNVSFIHSKSFSKTGDWQQWASYGEEVKLKKGNYTMRVTIEESSFNLNWINFTRKSSFSNAIPGKVQMENYYFSKGITLEDTEDVGGGKNISKPAEESYLEFNVNVEKSTDYDVVFRASSPFNKSGEVEVFSINDTEEILLLTQGFSNTGGWQEWSDYTNIITLEEGNYLLKIRVKAAGFNLNWIEFTEHSGDVTSIEDDLLAINVKVYPNPTSNNIKVKIDKNQGENIVSLLNSNGQLLTQKEINGWGELQFNLSNFPSGLYIIRVNNSHGSTVKKVFKR